MGAVCGRRSPRPTTIETYNWMEWFIGVSERELISSDEMRARALVNQDFVNVASGRRWPAGCFECHTVAQLEDRVQRLSLNTSPSSVVPLNVADNVDIGRLQAALKTEDFAMVQIASNFNCLEVPSRRHAPDSGYLVQKYATDATQGPAASFGVPAASLLRAHYAFKNEQTLPATWGQTAERQVELLENVKKWFGTCVNGKLTLAGDEEEIQHEQIDSVARQIRVGVHANAQVVFNRSSWGMLEIVQEPFPLVDQVLSASVCLPDPGKSKSEQQLSTMMRSALRASYEGAYLAAILQQRHLLLLTLVGGGVFGNPEDIILEELARAHVRWAGHEASKLREVRLCIYQQGAARRIGASLKGHLAMHTQVT
eukprot:TRINITY_DN73292_c0_g1_i1.p1 TRINITY_DN73292_c0_g1~~TRINITY_DN73292_c0_g1_i1.p1  ORF type:complete len:393 (+),score=34.89 TRINITY_DN73292_c0_g1_i1:73-1179(+)